MPQVLELELYCLNIQQKIMYTHVYFSHRLCSTEQNYDVGKRELLAIKLAQKEWQHCLEILNFPFIIWIDHKNLSNIQNTIKRNPR